MLPQNRKTVNFEGASPANRASPANPADTKGAKTQLARSAHQFGARQFLAPLTLLALFATILTTIAATAVATLASASPVAAQNPTPGSNTKAIAELTFRVPAPTSGSTPSLLLSFESNNSTRCPAGSSQRLFANSSEFTRNFVTNHDSTPSDSSDANQIDCVYTLDILSNLPTCSYTINTGSGNPITVVAPSSSNTRSDSALTLTATDSPNFNTGVGTFENASTSNTITITPSGCSLPAQSAIRGLVRVRNIETDQSYSTTFTPFGNCQTGNQPFEVVRPGEYSLAILDFRCNWSFTTAPVVTPSSSSSTSALTGCPASIIVYFTDGSHMVNSGDTLFIHGTGTNRALPAHGGRQIDRIELSVSTASQQPGECELRTELIIQVNLVDTASLQTHRNTTAIFTISPLSSSQPRGCSSRTTTTASNANPASVILVRSPAGTTSYCSYVVSTSRVAGPIQVIPAHTTERAFSTSTTSRITARFTYQLFRAPVRVSLEINTGNAIFTTNDRIRLNVSSPGPCGNDSEFLGGVRASTGTTYEFFVARGLMNIIGTGARFVNSFASYDLPPSVPVTTTTTTTSGTTTTTTSQPCVVRVTEISAYPGCRMGNSRLDSNGRPFIEGQWNSTTASFLVPVYYSCQTAALSPADPSSPLVPPTPPTDSSGTMPQTTMTLPRGWVLLPFNGATGTTPRNFWRELDQAFDSIWVWSASSQSWSGWLPTRASNSLQSLTRGDSVFVYVPERKLVTYTPTTLLQSASTGSTILVAPGFSLLSYGGRSAVSLRSLLANQSAISRVYRWDATTQRWEFFTPGATSTSSQWFEVLTPNDVVFVLNRSSRSVRIPWVTKSATAPSNAPSGRSGTGGDDGEHDALAG